MSCVGFLRGNGTAPRLLLVWRPTCFLVARTDRRGGFARGVVVSKKREAQVSTHYMEESSKALLDAAASFLWSDTLQGASDRFVEMHCHLFAGAKHDGEQHLDWQPLYLEYCGMYEQALEAFVISRGCTVEVFVRACRDALDNSEWAEHRGLASCVLAMAEYPYFLNMMAMAAAQDGDGGPEHENAVGLHDSDELLSPPEGLEGADEFGEFRPGVEKQHERKYEEDEDDFM